MIVVVNQKMPHDKTLLHCTKLQSLSTMQSAFGSDGQFNDKWAFLNIQIQF